MARDVDLFQEYSYRYSTAAREARGELPAEHLRTLLEIEASLADDPQRYPERLIPVSREGNNFVYSHPDPAIQVTFEIDEAQKMLYFFHVSAPTLQVKKSIFISYSHADEKWLLMLKKFLSVLEQQGVVSFWDDSDIDAGGKWRESIEEALESSRAAVLLVSQDFLQSSFIEDVELPTLLEAAAQEGKKIFWIPLSPSTVFDSHQQITQFQSPLKNPRTSLEELDEAQQKKALVEITRKLGDAISN